LASMFSPIQYIFIAAIVLYLLDSIWEVGSIFNPNRFSKKLADYFLLSGLSVHCAFLIIISSQSGTLPISTLFESSTFYLSLIVLLSVILKFLYRLQSLTPFVMPIVTGFSIDSRLKDILALCPHNTDIPGLCLVYCLFHIQHNVPDDGKTIEEKVLWSSF